MMTATEMNELVLEAKTHEEELINEFAKRHCYRLVCQMEIAAKGGHKSKVFSEKEIPPYSKESSILRKLGYKISRKGFLRKKVIINW